MASKHRGNSLVIHLSTVTWFGHHMVFERKMYIYIYTYMQLSHWRLVQDSKHESLDSCLLHSLPYPIQCLCKNKTNLGNGGPSRSLFFEPKREIEALSQQLNSKEYFKVPQEVPDILESEVSCQALDICI